MKTRHYMLFLLSLSLSIGTLVAQNSNRLYIPELTALPGSTLTIPVYVDNTTEIVAIQFALQVPEGSTLTTASAVLTSRAEDHTVTLRATAQQEYLCVIYSSSNSPLKGRTGKIMTVDMSVPSSYTEGSVHEFVLKDVVLSLRDGTNVLSSAEAGKLTIIKRPDLYVKNVQTDKAEFAPGETMSVNWQVQNIGGKETGDGWTEQISLVQADGTSVLLGTTYYDEILSVSGAVSRQATLTLPQFLGLDGQAKVQVQVIPRPNTGENEGARGNNIATTASTVNISKLLTLTLPTGSIAETYKQPIRCTLARSGNRTQEQTYTLTATEDSRITVPQTVTISAGQSATNFYIQIADNTVLDDNELITITASGNGYEAVSCQFAIEDNEFPNLTIAASESQVTEGESFQLTITTNRAPATFLEVTLASENNKRFTFPSKVTLPAGSTSVQVMVETVEDELPSLDISNVFTASAPNYNKGEVIVILQDNDMPTLELTLTPTNVQESAGPIAMMAVLRRLTHIDRDITVKLTDDSQNGDINYGQFSAISMASGVKEVSFSIGVNDNLLVDGDRDVTITAAVYIQSCSCSAVASEGVGAVSQVIHIVDNDGPSLSLTSSRSMLLEGTEEATLLTVSRNTSVAESLAVCITSDYDEGLEYNHNVVIPAGSRSTTIPVKVLANMTENDNVTVTFTASATEHSDGICWAMVSDQTMPDAIVNTMELLSMDDENIGEDGVLVNTKLKAHFTVKNIGVIDLPAGTMVTLYQNSQRITTITTHESLAPGESTFFSYILTVPDQIGIITAYAKVNEDQTIHELIYANNTSAMATVRVNTSYTATVSVDKNILQYGDSLTISGHISPIGGTTWQADGTTAVELYLIADGQRYVQRVLADATGAFVYRWRPSRYQMGHFGIGACYPDEGLRTEMVGVDIYGMRCVSNRASTFYTVLDQPYTGSIVITNPGRLPLTDFTVSETNNPDEASITFDAPTSIAGGETVNIGYTLISHKIGNDNDWQTLSFSMTTAEGPKLDYTLYYYTRNSQAQLCSSVKQINTTMIKGSTRDFAFEIANIGSGSTGNITLSLPQWMQSVTPQQMASLSPGDTTQVILRLMPTEDMQLNVPVTGQIAVNCENGNGLVIPFRIEPVSESTGNLVVDVCDEYTYYTEEAPHVCGATVLIQHPVTGAIIAEGTTDIFGSFNVTLPEGYYTLLVTHPKHSSYRANILLDPGKTTYKIVNLSYDAIEVSWDVVETTIEDVYNIVTTVKYETEVPVPVVTVSMPQSIEAHKLDEGESLIFYAVMTNIGLISAEDVQLSMPDGFHEILFEPLDMEEPFELAPQQSVVMPIKVTRLPFASNPSGQRRVQPLSDDDCYAQFPLAYFYECGADRKYHKYRTGLRVAECEGDEIRVNTSFEAGSDGGWGSVGVDRDGIPGGIGRPNYPGINVGSTISNKNTVSTGEPYQCEPCSNSALLDLVKFIPFVGPILEGAETAKDIYNCVYAFNHDEGLHDKLGNCKYTSGAVRAYDKYVDTVKDLYDDVNGMADYTGDLIQHVKNGEIFTEEALNDWKGIGRSLYDMHEDALSIVTQTQAVAARVDNLIEKTSDVYNDLQETNRVVYEGMNRWVTNDEGTIRDHQLDNYANAQTSLSPVKRERDIQQSMSELHEYYNKDIATKENYIDFLDNGIKLLTEGEGSLSREERRSLLQNGVRTLGDGLWNLHSFKDMSKTMNMNQQTTLKAAYFDTTNKLVDIAGDAADLIHHTFGECEYEGIPDEGDVQSNGKDSGNPENANLSSPRKALTVNFGKIPWECRDFLNKMDASIEIVNLSKEIELEFFGDSEWLNLSYIQFAPVDWAIEQMRLDGPSIIDNPNLSIYCPDGVSLDMMKRLLRRCYNSFFVPEHSSVRHSPASPLPEPDGSIQKMDLQHMEDLRQQISENVSTILSDDEVSIEEVVQRSLSAAYERLNSRSNSVCASITLQFNQTMTMTRQAFRGTLNIHNGNSEGAMRDIILQLEVCNISNGSFATSQEMQINVESLEGFEGPLSLADGWSLAPSGDGTATILFIPSKYAAPTEPQEYTFGGRISYLDPYSNTVVTRELSPVTLTVNPSPELNLIYFMQRDVYGDDPLTEDVVEPMVPAEFSLLINNIGNGDATNVRMVTSQPEIIENGKGLLIDFEILSAQLNGGDKTMALGGSMATDFGTIPAHSQAYAQWWLQSSLLGHFTEYDVQATHVTSYGNPGLSLLNDVTIHELIRSIKVDDGAVTGFVANDLPDSEDTPDIVYFTDGTTADVVLAVKATLQKQGDTEYLLTVTPSRAGWNYGHVVDPTFGRAKLTGIHRQSDGKEINLRNFWQTDRTLRDGKDWLYEDNLHFVDQMANTTETYILTFDPLPDMVLQVESFEGVPEENVVLHEPLQAVTVTFNKAIDATTFTREDITLYCQGTRVDNPIPITALSDTQFKLDLDQVEVVGGYYVLTVHTAGITDFEGFNGQVGAMTSWIQFTETKLALSFYDAEVTYGNSFMEPRVLTNSIAVPTFTSTNPFVASVDPESGNVTINAVGTTDVNVSLGETTMSDGAQTSYRLTVLQPEGSATAPSDIESVSITIPEGQSMTTFCSPWPIDFSGATDNCRAYTAIAYHDDIVECLEAIETKGGVGLLIVGVPGTYTFPVRTSFYDPMDNLFIGTLAPTYIEEMTDDRTNLGLKDIVFIPLEAGVLKANKAYMPIVLENNVNVVGIDLESATGLHIVTKPQDDAWYNISGMKVSRPTVKGIYIRNGRKIVK